MLLSDRLKYGTGGHLQYKALLEARKVVTGMPEFSNNHEGVCQGCAEGRYTRGPFPSSVTKTSDVLQLVHFDLSSMLPVTFLGGCSYYMRRTSSRTFAE